MRDDSHHPYDDMGAGSRAALSVSRFRVLAAHEVRAARFLLSKQELISALK
jgi:hypothetical protein